MENKSKTKAYFILRSDLNMSPAKLAVQVGHGTDMIHLRMALGRTPPEIAGIIDMAIFKPTQALVNYGDWLESDRTKIILKIGSIESLEDLRVMIRNREVSYCEIFDLGLTELDGLTKTGLVIFPTDEAPGVIRHMPKYTVT